MEKIFSTTGLFDFYFTYRIAESYSQAVIQVRGKLRVSDRDGSSILRYMCVKSRLRNFLTNSKAFIKALESLSNKVI